ncbi:MAG TPA: diphthine synthase [Candidatus Nanoarchaeia archaeon]|nr:diphthine synthase [Candidatus Nanoarchaeia archaeon]
MLALIGIGLAEPGDISVKGYNTAKQSDKIYLESYTSKLACSHEELEKFYGKKIHLANRVFVEDGKQLLEEAKNGNVALLVIGDPLCATTHWDILTRAKEMGIQTRVVHNASIMSAIGSTGLQVYKFGKTTSIPFPIEKFEPETAYDVILQNKAIGAHTLVLLDLRPDENKYMSVNEAIEILRKIDRRREEHGFVADDWCVGVARLGFPDQKIVAGTVMEASDVNFGAPPHALIVPGKLHFLEEEALAQWGAKRKDRKAKVEIWEK